MRIRASSAPIFRSSGLRAMAEYLSIVSAFSDVSNLIFVCSTPPCLPSGSLSRPPRSIRASGHLRSVRRRSARTMRRIRPPFWPGRAAAGLGVADHLARDQQHARQVVGPVGQRLGVAALGVGAGRARPVVRGHGRRRRRPAVAADDDERRQRQAHGDRGGPAGGQAHRHRIGLLLGRDASRHPVPREARLDDGGTSGVRRSDPDPGIDSGHFEIELRSPDLVSQLSAQDHDIHRGSSPGRPGGGPTSG